jgi:cytochrome c-type biogenesis protein CcmH/NrfG
MNALWVLLAGAVLAAAAAFWALRAYRRAGGTAAWPAVGACAFVAVVALGAYLATGKPYLSGQPYEARIAALEQRPFMSLSADEALALLAHKAKQDPGAAMPRLASGEILLRTGRAQEAAREFEAALRREPEQVQALLGLGEALVVLDGRFTPEAIALFQQASTLTEDPAPWVYQAMAATESGQAGEARRLWGEAYRRMSEDDPYREQARRLSAGAGR